jgi:hypothetical protein
MKKSLGYRVSAMGANDKYITFDYQTLGQLIEAIPDLAPEVHILDIHEVFETTEALDHLALVRILRTTLIAAHERGLPRP